jgi:phage shock protein PspC (stress-responsive transcriptional regulator)
MNDQDTTRQLPSGEPPPPSGEPPRRPKRLLRAQDDRMLLGVAAGLGRYFDVDPVIVRIGFALSVFIGGLGAFAYAALALFVPTGDDAGNVVERPPIERSRGLAIAAGIGILIVVLSWGVFDGGFFWDDGWFFGPPFLLIALAVGLFLVLRDRGSRSGDAPRSAGRTVGQIVLAIVLAFVALGVLSMIALASAWAGATGHGLVVAGVIAAIGVMLVLSAFRGGARWLLLPAAALAIPLALVSAADISFGDGIGDREYRPSSIAALPEEGYELGVGRLIVDLRDLDWRDDTVLDLDVDLGIGEAIVAVPESVCVSGELDSRAGELYLAGEDAEGIDPELDGGFATGSPPRLDLTGEVDIGVMRVINDDDADLDDQRHWRDHDEFTENDEEHREAMEAACAEVPVAPENAGASDEPQGRQRGG